jgi:cytidylate kinase
MVIQVGSEGDGKYFASKWTDRIGLGFVPAGIVFTLKQKEGESVQEFEERARQEAREYGIEHVHRLDD